MEQERRSPTSGYVTDEKSGVFEGLFRARIVLDDGSETSRIFPTRIAAECWMEVVLEDGELWH